MNEFLGAIGSVTGPLTLLAFLAVVALAMFRRAVKDERGLEYVYNLFQAKLTRQQFYTLATDVFKWGLAAFVLIFIASLAAFVLIKLAGSGGLISGDIVSGGEGDDVVITRSERIYAGDPPAPTGGSGNVVEGGPGNDVIVTDPDAQGIHMPNAWPRASETQRAQSGYAVAVAWGERSTAVLRRQFGLQPLDVAADDPRLEDEGIPYTALSPGVYAFTTIHTVGQVSPQEAFVFPTPGGSVTLEVHKRAGGAYAIAGFVSAAHGGLLADPGRRAPATVTVFALPQPEAGNAVAIPLARVEKVTVGKMFKPFGVEAVELTVW